MMPISEMYLQVLASWLANQRLSNSLDEAKPARQCVSKSDLMSGIYPTRLHRRIERRRAERVQSLRQIHGRIVAAIEHTLHCMFNRDGSLIPIPVKAVADRRRLDRCRLRD
jgi:hypothetical protein